MRLQQDVNLGRRGMLGLFLTGVFLAACGGCGRSPDATLPLTVQDYKSWHAICDSLSSQKERGLVVHAASFQALSDELNESKSVVAEYCRANGMAVERFLAVCRTVGLAYSVLTAERMDQEVARVPAAEMSGDLACKGHDVSHEEDVPAAALSPREPPPAILQDGGDDALARNVVLLRPVVADVDAVAGKLLSKPAEGSSSERPAHED